MFAVLVRKELCKIRTKSVVTVLSCNGSVMFSTEQRTHIYLLNQENADRVFECVWHAVREFVLSIWLGISWCANKRVCVPVSSRTCRIQCRHVRESQDSRHTEPWILRVHWTWSPSSPLIWSEIRTGLATCHGCFSRQHRPSLRPGFHSICYSPACGLYSPVRKPVLLLNNCHHGVMGVITKR